MKRLPFFPSPVSLLGRVPLLLAAMGITLLSAATSPAQTPVTYTVLHSFAAADASGHNSDGLQTFGDLKEGADGNLYGVASSGGANAYGTIFRVTPAGGFTTLHTFSANDSSGTNTDGNTPNPGLLLNADGSFYGTTFGGGAFYDGTIFRITADGQFSVFYTFSADGTADGGSPSAGLVKGDDGNYYGVTVTGTRYYGNIFKATPTGTVTGVYNFTNAGGLNRPSSLIKGSDGNFYGVTQGNNGAVFQYTTAGVLTPLHGFSVAVSSNGNRINSDGALPNAGLVQGADGAFYGTASSGGANGRGTIFRVTSAGEFSVVYTYPPYDATQPSVGGSRPKAGMLLGQDGNFYGTTSTGGAHDRGTIFRLTPDGTYSGIYSFGDQDPSTAQSDGSVPASVLSQASDGSLYGTTLNGGTYGTGVIFKLTFSTPPSFFAGETALASGVYYLSFPNGNPFGYYSYLTDPHYIFHFDLGYEYVFDAADGKGGVYLYDFASNGFFYSSPVFPFPYLYDFTLNTVLYYYPDPSNPGHYNTNGFRFFYRFDNGQIIVK